MAVDLLEGAPWECAACLPGEVAGPEGLAGAGLRWLAATVPGTAAGALAAAGSPAERRDLDAEDWWFRCRFQAPGGPAVVSIGGIATVADLWLDGVHRHHGENMFRAHRVGVDLEEGDHELVIRCAALAPLLGRRRSRPRWKSYLVTHQNLRWFRTALLGRIPGWAQTPPVVGPWRPVRLEGAGNLDVDRHVVATCDGEDGVIEATLRFGALGPAPRSVMLACGGVRTACQLRAEGDEVVAAGRLRVEGIERWWPHTHGPQPRYRLEAEVDGVSVDLGQVGFRTIELDRSDDGFSVVVNGLPVFCRGACWLPPDPVTLAAPDDEVRRRLELARDAHMNMVRVPGTGVYPDRAFFDLCDELGLLVWQDAMFAFLDPPDDEEFTAEVTAELTQVFGAMAGHPCIALVCGNQEVEEVAAMNGLPSERWSSALFEKTIPALLDALVPGTPYVTSNPTGGELPFQMDAGCSQYFGVGGYLRPLEDARRAGVRFAAECLAFATPPDPDVIDEHCGGARAAGHDPGWKEALHHDAGRSWDMDDVRDFYVRTLFDVDPLAARYVDPERALDLGRATNAHLMASVFTEWRRPGSGCGGGLVLALCDLRPGAGWGILDAFGHPKSPWFALRRTFEPLALLVTDEGLNGLRLHVVNDTAERFSGVVRVDLYARGEIRVDRGERPVEVLARGGVSIESVGLFEGFRDISYAFRFAPPAHDAVVATLLDRSGEVISEVVHLPLGQHRPIEPEVGLRAIARPGPNGAGPPWVLEVSTRRLAQWVSVEVPGFVPDDSWFHLAPQGLRQIGLRPLGSAERPRGSVRALNSDAVARVELEESAS